MEDLQSCGEPGGLWFSKYQLIIWLCEKLCMCLSVKWAAGLVLWHGGFYHSGGCLDCRAAEFLMSLMSKPWDKLWERATHIERTQEQCRSFKQTWPPSPKFHCAWTTLWEFNAFCLKIKVFYLCWERSRLSLTSNTWHSSHLWNWGHTTSGGIPHAKMSLATSYHISFTNSLQLLGRNGSGMALESVGSMDLD